MKLLLLLLAQEANGSSGGRAPRLLPTASLQTAARWGSSFKGNFHGLHLPDPNPGIYYVLV